MMVDLHNSRGFALNIVLNSWGFLKDIKSTSIELNLCHLKHTTMILQKTRSAEHNMYKLILCQSHSPFSAGFWDFLSIDSFTCKKYTWNMSTVLQSWFLILYHYYICSPLIDMRRYLLKNKSCNVDSCVAVCDVRGEERKLIPVA